MQKIISFFKKYYNYLLFILVGVLTVYIISRQVKIEEFLAVVEHADLFYLGLSLFLLVIYWLMESALLATLIRFEYPDESFRHAFTVVMIGQYYNLITPSSSGGQPLQLLELNSRGVNLGIGTAILVEKFALYELSVTIVGVLGVLTNIPEILSWDPAGKLLLIIGLLTNLTGSIFILVISFNYKIAEFLLNWLLKVLVKLHIVKDKAKWEERFNTFVSQYKVAADGLSEKKSKAFILLLINILAIIVYYAITYTLFRALNVNSISILKIILLQAVCYLMIAFVPLPGSAGGAEIGFVIVFSTLVGTTKTSVAVLGWRLITFYFVLAFAGIFISIYSLINKGEKEKLRHRENEKD